MAKVSIIPWIVKKMKKCLGITEDTNTASRSISSGEYVIWKGDAYKASSSISEGDTLSSSNLTAVTDGVGNDLKQAVANKPDYATEMPMSSSDATKVSQAIANLETFHKGDIFNLAGAQLNFRTLANLSAVYFRYRLPKTVANDVTTFSVTINALSSCWSNCNVISINTNATIANIEIYDKRTISFSATPTSSIPAAGYGVCELNASIVFS